MSHTNTARKNTLVIQIVQIADFFISKIFKNYATSEISFYFFYTPYKIYKLCNIHYTLLKYKVFNVFFFYKILNLFLGMKRNCQKELKIEITLKIDMTASEAEELVYTKDSTIGVLTFSIFFNILVMGPHFGVQPKFIRVHPASDISTWYAKWYDCGIVSLSLNGT